MNGYVKLFRSIEKWEWYTDVNTTKLFLHCLIKANHKASKWRGIVIESGSFITSYGKLSAETGLSVRNVRTSLNRLKSTQEVTHQTTNDYSIISIVKWSLYQSSEDLADTENDTVSDNQVTSKRQASDKQVTTNKNDKNVKNDKNNKKNGNFVPPTQDEVQSYIDEKGYSVVAQRFISFYESKGWMVGKNKMRDWKSALSGWNTRNLEPKRSGKVETPTNYPSIEVEDVDEKALAEQFAKLGGLYE